jgi:hypothetical protein
VEAQKEVTRFAELKEFEKERSLLEVSNLKTTIETTITESQKEVARVSDQKEFEKEKALLAQEKLFNKQMQEQQAESYKKVLEYQKQAGDFIRRMQIQQQNQDTKHI